MASVSKKTCSVEGCDDKVTSKGYCDKHRRQLKRHGKIIESFRGFIGCSVPSCESKHFARGYCRKHHMRILKHGVPEPKELSILERIMQKTDSSGECWLWQGNFYNNGYGRISYQNRQRLVHRLMYALEVGQIPSGKVVMHQCDNKACVNPKHLALGSQADNLLDMHRKGRWYADRRGSHNGRSKITEDQVREIRDLRIKGLTCPQISMALKIPLGTVESVASNRTWKHVA